jgi:predicted RNA-binding Zn-ribbon protein involved in translation (DUF1610 family)
MKNGTQKSRGPWFHRALVFTFSILLGVLIYWLLGFVMKDIGTWPGPAYAEVENRLLDQELVKRLQDLTGQIEEVNRGIAVDKKRQEVLSNSTSSSERTMNQLLELQRLALQRTVTPTQAEQTALAQSEQLFLANQQKYQEINEKIAELTEQLHNLETQKRELNKNLEKQRQPVQQEYNVLVRRHNFKLAAIKLAVLIPLLAVAGMLALKKRASLYAPLIYAFGLAVLVKVFMVMHEHFPTRYFKYVLILAVLALVAWVLVYLLRMVAYPKREWLLKQYREAYESFFCPVCSFPIRRGPLRYRFWSRRSLKKLSVLPETTAEADQPYVCPLCGTRLFEECEACHAIRHALLPACAQCGKEKELPASVR